MTVEENLIVELCRKLQCRMRLTFVETANGKRGFQIGVVDAWDTTQYFFESDYSEHMTEYYLRRQVGRKAVAVLTRAVEKRAAEQALLKQAPTPNPPSAPTLPPAPTLPRLPLSAKLWLQQQEQQEQEAAGFAPQDITLWRRKPLPQEAK